MKRRLDFDRTSLGSIEVLRYDTPRGWLTIDEMCVAAVRGEATGPEVEMLTRLGYGRWIRGQVATHAA